MERYFVFRGKKGATGTVESFGTTLPQPIELVEDLSGYILGVQIGHEVLSVVAPQVMQEFSSRISIILGTVINKLP